MVCCCSTGRAGEQYAFLFGPPPLGPSAPPSERLLAFGDALHPLPAPAHELLSAANRDPTAMTEPRAARAADHDARPHCSAKAATPQAISTLRRTPYWRWLVRLEP